LIFSKHILNNYLPKLLFLSLLASTTFAYSGGTGTAQNPYQIANPNDLLALAADANDYSKAFILVNDINLAGLTFNTAVIAPDTVSFPVSVFDGTPFAGVFDGSGHSILNLTINVEGTYKDYLGLFGRIDAGGIVKNLGIKDVTIIAGENWIFEGGSHFVGRLCGYIYDGNISNCFSTGKVTGDISKNGGGLCGYSEQSNISDCYSTGQVTGGRQIGGLCGDSNYSNISNCYSTGTVSGVDNIGGLVGKNQGSISNCYSMGAVSDGSDVGGLVGDNYGTISNCYSIGAVGGSSGYHVGGLVGYSPGGTTNNSFWDVNTSGWSTSDGGTGKTTAQMKTLSTFTSAGWDFSYTDGSEAIWFMPINEYPILTWQISPADIYTDGKNNFRDFAVFASYWMRDDCRRYNSYCDWADLNFDGSVDIDDLIEFMNYWLQSGIYE
jgi:hypothetical protein